jgi:hypothetical protein
MTTPSPDELHRYTELLGQGFEPSEAAEAIWQAPIDLPTPPAPTKPTRPTTMLTEFPDGIVIGWDTCTACHRPVATCACKGGPVEPKVFAKWRGDAVAMPAYGRAKATTPVSVDAAPAAGITRGPAAGTEVVASTSVLCREHEDWVLAEQADRNDDDTWTCHACQDAGVQKARA